LFQIQSSLVESHRNLTALCEELMSRRYLINPQVVPSSESNHVVTGSYSTHTVPCCPVRGMC